MAATETLPSFDPMPGVWPRYHGKPFFSSCGILPASHAGEILGVSVGTCTGVPTAFRDVLFLFYITLGTATHSVCFYRVLNCFKLSLSLLSTQPPTRGLCPDFLSRMTEFEISLTSRNLPVGKDSMCIARQFGRISRLGAEITGIVGAPPEIQCLTQPPLCQALPCQAFLMTPVSH